MAVFSSSGSKSVSLVDAYALVRSLVGSIKGQAQTLNAQATGSVDATTLLTFIRTLSDLRARLATAVARTGLTAYAQGQEGVPTYDIVAEVNSTLTQVDATVTWMLNNFPKDATTGYLLAFTFAPDNTGRLVDRVFTAAQLSGLRTVLAALIATID